MITLSIMNYDDDIAGGPNPVGQVSNVHDGGIGHQPEGKLWNQETPRFHQRSGEQGFESDKHHAIPGAGASEGGHDGRLSLDGRGWVRFGPHA